MANNDCDQSKQIYGLDVDFLKEIGNEEIVKEYENIESNQDELLQKRNILALEHKFKKPTKLREICKEFRTEQQ